MEIKHHHHHHQKDHDAFALVLLFTWYVFVASFDSTDNKELQVHSQQSNWKKIVAYFRNDNSKLDDVVYHLLQFSLSGQ